MHELLADGAVLGAELGQGSVPTLATASPTATVKGAVRQWSSVDDFVQEVVDARVYGGVHYRFSSDAGRTMGRRIGELAAARLTAVP